MKIKTKGLKLSAVFSLLLILAILTSCGGDQTFNDKWSDYRGVNRDGISTSKVPLKVWEKDSQPPLVWKHKIGDGFSGIVVDGTRIITAFAEDSMEVIAGYDRKTGKELWRQNIGKEFVEEFGNGPRATPTLDGKQAFIYNSWGHLYAVDTETGKINWKHYLSDSLKIRMPQRGHCTSPIVVGNNVVIHAGGRTDNTAFLAFDKITGEKKWQTGETVVSYSSPFLANIYNEPQIVFSATKIVMKDGKRRGARKIVALSPEGKEIWDGPSVPAVIAMPLFIPPNKVFVSSSEDKYGCMLIEVKKENNSFAADTVWFSEEMQNHFNSSVYYNGYIYGFSNATLHCIDAKTGKRTWRKRGLGKGSLIISDNKLVILTDRGKLVLAEVNSKKFVQLAKAKVIEGLSWTSPTLADGKLYLRSREEIACYDLSK
ncbi:MAG: PQQ-binding-like beta-propeller repeat protein [Rhodothermaceae bacterium]